MLCSGQLVRISKNGAAVEESETLLDPTAALEHSSIDATAVLVSEPSVFTLTARPDRGRSVRSFHKDPIDPASRAWKWPDRSGESRAWQRPFPTQKSSQARVGFDYLLPFSQLQTPSMTIRCQSELEASFEYSRRNHSSRDKALRS